MEQREGTMVLLAIFVSRFEAVLIAGMLDGYGIYTSLDAEGHASVEYTSMAFGGHRLRVCAEDHSAASEILRQSGAPEHELFRKTPRPALLWFIALWSGLHASAALLGGAPVFAVLLGVSSALGIPVDPKGRADYFLSEPIDQAF